MKPILAFEFARPGKPTSMNSAKGMHWSALERLRAPWYDATYFHARQALVRYERAGNGVWQAPTPSLVRVTIPFVQNRRRDAHNYTSTVVKWMVDALVTARVFDDDSTNHVIVLDSILVKDPDLTVRVDVYANE